MYIIFKGKKIYIDVQYSMIFKNIKYMYCNDNIYENLLWNYFFFFGGGIFMDFLGIFF